eukprot:TRINITY_DN16432_c0_g1_i1.p1 TRINITY_DN16432_c0_g1~~TRINITY_DN16432_c0_g1_i1.p1  ORF type:complete len:492 (+),score=55.57 TRINITY_DN16432_c0_g1_i1:112-1587(+)
MVNKQEGSAYHDVGTSYSFSPRSQRRLKLKSQQGDEVDDWGKTIFDQEIGVQEVREELKKQGVKKTAEQDYYTLLRFLRARDYDVEKASEMYIAHLQWRKEYGTDTIIQDFDFKERDQFLAVYPQGYHKTDKQGRPIYIQHLGQIDLKKITQVTTVERMIKFHVQEWERCMHSIFPACSKKEGRRVDQMFAIMDVSGVGVHMLSADVRATLKEITKIDQDNYPESLGKVFIINAPFVFKAVWAFIQPLLNPRTRGKIELNGKNYLPSLLEYVDVDSIPQYLGGTSNYTLVDDVGPWNDPMFKKMDSVVREELVPMMLMRDGQYRRAESPPQDSVVDQQTEAHLKPKEKSIEDGFFTPRSFSFAEEHSRSFSKENYALPNGQEIELRQIQKYQAPNLSLLERVRRLEEFVRPRLLLKEDVDAEDGYLRDQQSNDFSQDVPLVQRVQHLESAFEVLLISEESRQRCQRLSVGNSHSENTEAQRRLCCKVCRIM